MRVQEWTKRIAIYPLSSPNIAWNNKWPITIAERTPTKPGTKWKRIKHNVSKFYWLYLHLKALNESGKSDDDHMHHSHQLYQLKRLKGLNLDMNIVGISWERYHVGWSFVTIRRRHSHPLRGRGSPTLDYLCWGCLLRQEGFSTSDGVTHCLTGGMNITP